MNRDADLILTAPINLAHASMTKDPVSLGPSDELAPRSEDGPLSGHLIINADDWGRDREATDRTLECIGRGAVSSVSAMVFMADSKRAAGIAREREIDAGLHLNFTTLCSPADCPSRFLERLSEVAKYLRRYRLAQVVFHPALMKSFEYVVSAQLDEYKRLYGVGPGRVDGHHHMHLCANVLLAGLLPSGTIARRNFTFQPGEKGFVNRFYRRIVDNLLARHHQLTDYFFSLPPLDPPDRLRRIFSLARQSVVEVETHPAKPEESRFLAGGDIFRWAGDCPVAPRFCMRSKATAAH